MPGLNSFRQLNPEPLFVKAADLVQKKVEPRYIKTQLQLKGEFSKSKSTFKTNARKQ